MWDYDSGCLVAILTSKKSKSIELTAETDSRNYVELPLVGD